MITVLEYYALARPQLAGLSGAALLNAERSMLANAPTASAAGTSGIFAVVDDTQPHFITDPDTGIPKLVIPQPAPPAVPSPSPPGSVPPAIPPTGTTVTTTPPATQPPVQNVTPQPGQTITVPAGSPCPSGYVASSGGTTPVTPTPTIEQQVQSAFSQLPPTVQAFGCKCNPVIAAPWPITPDDAVVVNLWNIASCPTTVTANVKTMDCNCNIQTTSQSVSMAAYVRSGAGAFGAPLTATIKIPLSDGFLLSVNVSMTATFGIEAHMYALAQLIGATGTGLPTATLFQDYLVQGQALGWPGGRQISVGEGPGTMRWRSLAWDPNSGQSDTWQVHGGSRALMLGAMFSLTTSAAAGTREVYLQYSPPESPGFPPLTGALALGPSSSASYLFAPGIQPLSTPANFMVLVPIPPNIWNGGAGGVTVNVDNSDNADSGQFNVWFQMWAGPPVAF